MSLYKTQRCRHFDEAGNPIKPYCSQGNKCRFIHPNDHQWAKLKRRNEGTPSPEDRESMRAKGKHKPQTSPGSPFLRQRSSPLMPQGDLFKRKQKDAPREHDNRDWLVRNGDRRRDSEAWAHGRERNGPFEPGYSLKRPNDEVDVYPNQRPRLSERPLHAPSSGGGYNSNTRRPAEIDKVSIPVPHVPDRDTKTTSKVSDTFDRLARLCCQIVQGTCFLDREEDKLKAFTGLSSELSRAVPDAAMAVTPALATVITGHTRTRERLESHVRELESLWKTLFSVLEDDISKVIESRLEQAMALLDKERDNVLRAINRSQKFADDGATGSRQWIDGRRDMAMDRAATVSERGTVSVNGGPATNMSPEEIYHYGGSTSLSLVPTQEGDLGTSLKTVLEDMKMQMDRQTRAIEQLAQENLQVGLHKLEQDAADHDYSKLRSGSERVPPQLVPPDSPRKASIL